MVAELGQYVHAIGTDSNNSMEPRSIEAIYIEPTKGQCTGHPVLNLNTKKIISRPKVVVLPVTDQVIQRVEAWAAAKGVTSMKFFDKKRDLETFQDGDQIAGVDDTEQELLADAGNDVDDMPELTVRFQGDDDYESDDNSGDEGDEEEEPTVADLDHHQENVDRGTDDIGSLVTDLEDLQEPPGEEIVFEPEEPQVAKVTRSGQTYAQAAMSGLNLSQVPKRPREWPLSRSGSSANKNKNRVATRRKHQERELKPLKNKLKSGICTKEGSHITEDSKAIIEAKHNICFQQIGNEMKADYEEHDAILIARCMMQIKAKFDTDEGLNFIQQYYINQGLKKLGDDGKDAVDKELRQMLLRDCFTPKFVKDMTASERKKAQSAIMLLAEKQFEKKIKGRLVYRGDGTREWLSREDTASPTALQEAITTTCVIDAHEGRDVMTLDVPNAFIQTYMPDAKEGEDRVYMKITGMMVQILIDMAPEYREYVVLENRKRVIYVRVLRAIYGMLQLSLLFYNQFQNDLEAKGFVFNLYDPCVANKVVDDKQQTIRFHVDNLMSSHMDPKVNGEFAEWLNMR
ncbi:unnamed protein product [Cylindrotheca closterium]|uniref:Reverse transcriptase Ty1/copia-type domain-containing protein n=1 Tax=Cylindrotheca closterium TaxID=2856 RepID=A0AAD2GBK8_9STRA|nr:unnamed protein product [Cylindrotheca closterium]